MAAGGIGRGVVERFLEEGARVAILQRRPLDEDLAEHPHVFGVRVDLADARAIPNAVDEAAEALGGLDTVVNNAGIMFERSPAEITVEEWDRMMAVNLRAPMLVVGGAAVSAGERVRRCRQHRLHRGLRHAS